MKEIIQLDGTIIALSQFQKLYGLPANKVGKFFSVREFPDSFVLAEPLIRLTDLIRAYRDKPMVINSSYRSQSTQDKLRSQTFRAALTSPHVVGMGFDLDTNTDQETYELVSTTEYCAKLLDYKVRIGYKTYMADGSTFVHVDVCPMYYAKGMPFNRKNHPEPWEREARW